MYCVKAIPEFDSKTQLNDTMVQFIEEEYFRKGKGVSAALCESVCNSLGEMFKFIEYSVIIYLDITRQEWAYRLSLSSKNESILKQNSLPVSPKPNPNPSLLKIAKSIDLNNV